MEPVFYITKEKILELAEWLITGLVLVYGFQYLKQIVAYVLTELHRIFLQGPSPFNFGY